MRSRIWLPMILMNEILIVWQMVVDRAGTRFKKWECVIWSVWASWLSRLLCFFFQFFLRDSLQFLISRSWFENCVLSAFCSRLRLAKCHIKKNVKQNTNAKPNTHVCLPIIPSHSLFSIYSFGVSELIAFNLIESILQIAEYLKKNCYRLLCEPFRTENGNNGTFADCSATLKMNCFINKLAMVPFPSVINNNK